MLYNVTSLILQQSVASYIDVSLVNKKFRSPQVIISGILATDYAVNGLCCRFNANI